MLADEAEVHTLAVDPGWRRRGLGCFLLRQALGLARGRGARAAVLEVRAHNEAALRLYEASGFGIVGRRRDYYRLPVDDALLLRIDLQPSEGPDARTTALN
jgi:ribosomal-protein-alanine N-acetyltransferase